MKDNHGLAAGAMITGTVATVACTFAPPHVEEQHPAASSLAVPHPDHTHREDSVDQILSRYIAAAASGGRTGFIQSTLEGASAAFFGSTSDDTMQVVQEVLRQRRETVAALSNQGKEAEA